MGIKAINKSLFLSPLAILPFLSISFYVHFFAIRFALAHWPLCQRSMANVVVVVVVYAGDGCAALAFSLFVCSLDRCSFLCSFSIRCGIVLVDCRRFSCAYALLCTKYG